MIFPPHLQHRTTRGSMLRVSASFEAAPASGASMNVQHQRHALSAVMAGLVLLLAGCASGTAAAAPSPSVAAAAATAADSPTTSSATMSSAVARSSAALGSGHSTAPLPTPTANGDSRPGCAARAMAKGTFNPACDEYQGYLDPGTAGGREPTSGEIQRQNLCRAGQIPKAEC
jgi:hypothetical protein